LSDGYSWSGGREFWLRTGINHPLQVVMVPPIFEEANRMRRIIVQVMRALDGLGIGSVFPDLPGMNESTQRLADVSMPDWREALGACVAMVQGNTISAAFRGGALIDDAAQCSAAWRCAPETGQRVARDLMRTNPGVKPIGDHIVLAGNTMHTKLLDAIAAAAPAPHPKLRTVRLATDAAPCDAQIGGSPVWRRSEPGDDDALVTAITSDLSTWAETCAAS
jgi:hypothetical protein